MRRATVVLALFLALGAPAWAAPPPELPIEIHTWTLDNGLKVVYSPHRAVPAVTVQLWYHVGSKDEQVGVRGIAHMFEHMMFKGSQRVPPEEHARLISGLGGSVNAFTAADLTAYHNTLPRQYLDFAMQLEAERMRHLLLTPSTIKSEREVVKEEKRMRLENNPIGRSLEAIHKLAYTEHPYSWTPAGVVEDLNRVTGADCQAFYDRYYRPNNATLIVVGDADEAEVRRAAQRWFGEVPAGEPPPRVTVKEPPQQKTRELWASWPSQLKVVLGAYHVPAAGHPDMAPLEVLGAILSRGKSSRLHQALVRKGRLAVAAGGFLREQEQPGLMMIYALGLPKQQLIALKGALLGEVERVAAEGVSAAELDKAKAQLATGQLASLRTLSGRAYSLGNSALLRGDPRALLGDVARIDAVTRADVQRVARTYLKRTNLSLVLLGEPRADQNGEAPAPAAQPKGGAR